MFFYTWSLRLRFLHYKRICPKCPPPSHGSATLSPSPGSSDNWRKMWRLIKALQPGPLGIIEHKFSAEEVREAKATVDRTVENWGMNAILEKRGPILKDYIDI